MGRHRGSGVERNSLVGCDGPTFPSLLSQTPIAVDAYRLHRRTDVYEKPRLEKVAAGLDGRLFG
jgi:hypothetical protein